MRRCTLIEFVASTIIAWITLQSIPGKAFGELVLYYDFNTVSSSDMATDVTGNGNDGEVYLAEYTPPGSGHTGEAGDRAMDFLTQLDPAYIDILSAAEGALDSLVEKDAVTVSVWLYGSDEQPADGTVFWFAGDDQRQLLAHVPWSDSVIYFDMAGCDSCLFTSEPDESNYMGQWNHYAFVKDGEQAAIYQNGELLIDTDGMSALDNIWTARFGTFASDAYPYSGLMDDIAVWDEALPEEAIARLAAGEPPIGGIAGDFNGDGILDTRDIDDLTQQSASNLNPPKYDLNGDTLVNVADVELWAKDLFGTWIGDANLDREFNSGDLVAVLSSGTYEADVDAVWSTGDFNANGRTDTSDLVAALSDGGYEVGPRAAVSAVPEPAAMLSTALCGLVVAVASRRLQRKLPRSG